MGVASTSTDQVGVQIATGPGTEVVNNFVHGGLSSRSSYAVIVLNVNGTQVAHNTIVQGNQANPSVGLRLDGPTTTLVDDNLFVAPPANGVGVQLLRCNGASMTPRNNAFAGEVAAVRDYATPGNCGPSNELRTSDDLVKHGGSGNGVIATACGNDPMCRVAAGCASGAGCGFDLFEAFDPNTRGRVEVVAGALRLKAGGLCIVQEGGVDLTATIPLDAFGTKRTPPVSVGAQELDGPCASGK
jgi:hypothetical protein